MVSIINYPYSFQEHCPHVHVRVEEEEYGLEPSFHFPITVRERLFYYVEIFLGNIYIFFYGEPFLWLVLWSHSFSYLKSFLPRKQNHILGQQK